MTKPNYVISLSGGKDSTAMAHMMLERGDKIHSVVFFDTGWEFPAMHEHIKLFEKKTGLKVWRLQSRLPFEYWMFHRPIMARKIGLIKLDIKQLQDKWNEIRQYQEMPLEIPDNKEALIRGITGKVHRIGNGWPSHSRRWCTSKKVDAIDTYMKPIPNPVSCIGYASDELKRTEITNETSKHKKRYPLIEYGITEAEALQYCYDLGYHWDGLYEYFSRVSCFCCPLQPLNELRTLRVNFPELWLEMLRMDSLCPGHNRGFNKYKTVHDLEKRFAEERVKIQHRDSQRQLMTVNNCLGVIL